MSKLPLAIGLAGLLALTGAAHPRAVSPVVEHALPVGDAVQRPATDTGTIAIDADRYRLTTTPTGFLLMSVSEPNRPSIAIPRGWLIPRDEEAAEEAGYVSSFKYAEQVTSFEIGDGRVGLQISSYEVQAEGSAQAAAGRDVFLVLDPRRGRLFDPSFRLGVTRHRVRALGCIEASQSTFLLSDVNDDRRLDLGMIREEFVCRVAERDGVETVEGPVYVSYPIRWHVFAGDSWKPEERLTGRSPAGSRIELSSAGTPVDFVKALIGRRR